MRYIQIQWTAPTEKEAEEVVKKLLEKRWIACANLIPNIQSFFIWEGKIQKETEVKVLLKTDEKHFSKICGYIREHASYDVPEIAKIEITDANPDYVEWLKTSI